MWFQGIYFMTQDKKGASAMKLHRQLGISYNAAWRMRHKLMQVMMGETAPIRSADSSSSTMPTSAASAAGASAMRGAPGKTPSVAAVETRRAATRMTREVTVVEGFRLTQSPLGGST